MVTVYDFNLKDKKGNEVSLETYKGKVLLIVNTATGCGFTPQYEELEAMYRSLKEKGLEILDIPCDQFGHQAPGTDEEIHEFCTWSLMTELITWNIENLKTLLLQAAVHCLQLLILWSETTTRCCVYNKEYLTLICLKTYLITLLVLQIKIINCCHNSLLFIKFYNYIFIPYKLSASHPLAMLLQINRLYNLSYLNLAKPLFLFAKI